MNENINNSVARGIHVLESLFENGFQGKTETEVSKDTGIPLTTVFRILNTLKEENWVVEIPVKGSKLKLWKVSLAITEISKAYEVNALKQVQQIKSEHLRVIGKELKA